jgi:hypothetical protein
MTATAQSALGRPDAAMRGPGDFVIDALLVLMAIIWASQLHRRQVSARAPFHPLAYNAVRIVMA